MQASGPQKGKGWAWAWGKAFQAPSSFLPYRCVVLTLLESEFYGTIAFNLLLNWWEEVERATSFSDAAGWLCQPPGAKGGRGAWGSGPVPWVPFCPRLCVLHLPLLLGCGAVSCIFQLVSCGAQLSRQTVWAEAGCLFMVCCSCPPFTNPSQDF